MIEIKNIKGYGYHGVFANEREIGQEFYVDVSADLVCSYNTLNEYGYLTTRREKNLDALV